MDKRKKQNICLYEDIEKKKKEKKYFFSFKI